MAHAHIGGVYASPAVQGEQGGTNIVYSATDARCSDRRIDCWHLVYHAKYIEKRYECPGKRDQ